MADRQLNAATTIYADFPGLVEGEPVTVSLINPLGSPVVLDTITAQARGEGRYTFAVPSLTLSMSGIWTAVWTGPTGDTITQTFSVGQQPLAPLTRWNARIQLARRVESVVMGRVSYATEQSITDNSLMGGSDEYQYWWLMFPPDTVEAGRVFRITSWNASVLEVSDNFIETPRIHQPFALFNIDPFELDQALDAAIAEVSPLARIEEVIGPVVPTLGMVTVPRGISYVYEVWDDTTEQPLGWDEWSVRTQRRLNVPTTSASVYLRGLRDAATPVWDDSVIETPVASTMARASINLHAARASGPALDFEEHLRRQVAAQEDFERSLRRTAGRMPAGIREVVF